MTYLNGTTYQGEWHDNFANGSGKFVSLDGIIYSGMFTQGKFNYSESVKYNSNLDYTKQGKLLYRHGISMEPISLAREELFKVDKKLF